MKRVALAVLLLLATPAFAASAAKPCAKGAGVLCCCVTWTGGLCCNEVGFCGSFIPGCMCKL